MKHILVTTDFSDNSKAAFAYAIQQASYAGVDQCTLTVLCVLEDLIPTSVQFEFGITTFDSKGLLDEAYRNASARLKEVCAKELSGVRAQPVVVKAKKPVAEEIIDYAKEEDIHLIVMGTHGRSGVRRLLVGSVAEDVVRHSPCPVLLVPNTLE